MKKGCQIINSVSKSNNGIKEDRQINNLPIYVCVLLCK